MKKSIFMIHMILLLLLSGSLFQCIFNNPPNNDDETIIWQSVFSDDFQRSDGANIGDYSVQIGDESEVVTLFGGRLQLAGEGFWAVRYSIAVPGDTVRASAIFVVQSGNPAYGISVKNKSIANNWREQEFYSVFVDSSSMGIYRCQGVSPLSLITKSYAMDTGHSYKLRLTAINREIFAHIEDIDTGSKDSLTINDTNSLLLGSTVSFNGMHGTAIDTLQIDDFCIFVGK